MTTRNRLSRPFVTHFSRVKFCQLSLKKELTCAFSKKILTFILAHTLSDSRSPLSLSLSFSRSYQAWSNWKTVGRKVSQSLAHRCFSRSELNYDVTCVWWRKWSANEAFGTVSVIYGTNRRCQFWMHLIYRQFIELFIFNAFSTK